MAVLPNQQEFATYQERQLEALESIEDMFGNSYKLQEMLYTSVSKIPDTVYGAANIIARAISSMMDDRDDSDNPDDLEEPLNEALQEYRREEAISRKERRDDSKELRGSILSLGDILAGLGSAITKLSPSIDEYSQLLNQTIKLTGSNQDEAQAFRRNILNTVDSLNKEVGYKFNPKEVLSTMLSISESTSISNRETLEEITTPIMLAQESMNINISSLADTTGRLYTRYRFTSGDLEELVSSIRNTTEGKDVSEADILESMNKLEDRVAISVGGDKEKLQQLLDEVGNTTAYLEASYVDSAPYIEDLYKFLSQDIVERSSLARKYSSYGEIQELVNSGSFGKAVELMISTIADYNPAVAANGWNVPIEVWDEAKAATITDSLTSYEEFLASIDESQDARETVEEQYISIADKISNQLAGITSYLATLQENIGIGFSDVASLLYIGSNLKATFSGALGKVGLDMTSKGGGLFKALGGVGAALGVAGAAVGVALLIKGIADKLDRSLEDRVSDYDDAFSTTAEDSPYGFGLSPTFDSETGETKWELKPFASQEEADSYDYKSIVDQYVKDNYENLAWYEKAFDTAATVVGGGLLKFGAKLIGDDEFAGEVERIQENGGVYKSELYDLADYGHLITNTGNPEAYNFYQSKGLLDESYEIMFYGSRVPTIDSLYSKGYYIVNDEEGEQVKYYSVEDDSLVDVKPYATGTNYVTHDQLAYIHEGEAIVPEKYNPAANMNELERLRKDENSDTVGSINEVNKTLSDIREFLEQWKYYEDKKELLATSPTYQQLANRNKVASYTIL